MSEKRKSDSISSGSTNNDSKKSKIIEQTISSAPVKYSKDLEFDRPVPQIHPIYQQQIEQSIQNTPIILAERAAAARGTSYQEALKAAEHTHSKPQYVFPQYAPNKGNTNANNSIFAKRYYRKAAGETWEDMTLADWPEDDYRIFVGDLGNEVTDEVLTKAFARYPSFLRAKVIRDKKTTKSRGYGFVSLKDPLDFTRAMKEMNGKYIGNRPCKLKKSNWKDREDPQRTASNYQRKHK